MRTYKENAELFLKYLHDNDCSTTGPFGNYPVELDKLPDGTYSIYLDSQAGFMKFLFLDSGAVEVQCELDNGDEVINLNKEFNNFNYFCDWYSSQDFTWTDDLGSGVKSLKE